MSSSFGSFGASFGAFGGGVGGLAPAAPQDLKQRLNLTSQNTSPQQWLTVSDSLSLLTEPTIVGGAIRQSDSFFTGGTESVYSDGTTIEDKTFEHLLIHYYNTNGSNGLWVRKISDTVWDADQYDLSKDFTLTEYNTNTAFYQKGGGALRDINGDVVLDANGYVIFAKYEDELALHIIPPPELIPDLNDIPV